MFTSLRKPSRGGEKNGRHGGGSTSPSRHSNGGKKSASSRSPRQSPNNDRKMRLMRDPSGYVGNNWQSHKVTSTSNEAHNDTSSSSSRKENEIVWSPIAEREEKPKRPKPFVMPARRLSFLDDDWSICESDSPTEDTTDHSSSLFVVDDSATKRDENQPTAVETTAAPNLSKCGSSKLMRRNECKSKKTSTDIPRPPRIVLPQPMIQDDEFATNVVIVGGGPVALVTALLLLEYGRRRNVPFHITIHERRWVKTEEDDKIRWCGSQEYNNRRWQVVTLQANVYSQLPQDVQQTLFSSNQNYVEMWPYGPDSPKDVGAPRNIPVRVIEDKLLALLQTEPYSRHVSLKIGSAKEEHFADADFVVLANGGGANKIPGIPSFGKDIPFREDPDLQLSETVLGIFVQHPEGDGDAIGVSESEGMALTVAQNRFLLNPLGRKMGFLNMWLSWEEAQAAVGFNPNNDGPRVVTCSQGRPCMMFNEGGNFECKGVSFMPAQLKGPLWDDIQDGLKLYGIDKSCVKAFTTFKLGPFTKRTNFFMPLSRGAPKNRRRQPMVFCVGDAAMKVSFKGGRGLNTGIKGAMSLARTLCNAAEQGHWRYADFVAHSSFMFALQEREVRIRTLGLMSFHASGDTEQTCTSVTGRIAAGQKPLPFRNGQRRMQDATNGGRQRIMQRLETIGTNALSGDRLPKGIDPPRMDVLREKIANASDSIIRVMDSSMEQNTREVGGPEVNVDHYVVEPQSQQQN